MPFIPAPNIVEVQFRTTYGDQATMNRIHVDVFTEPTELICQGLATACGEWWVDNVLAITPTTLVLREVYVKSLASQPGAEATFSAGLPAPGTFGQPQLPNNCTIAVSLRSGLTGRSARGRWYWQGLTEGQVTGNQLGTGAETDILAAMQNLKNAVEAARYSWVIVSFFSGGGPRPGGPVYFNVTDILLVDSTVDSQRRRLPGRGR